MSILVIGLDLSLTSAGIATIEHDGADMTVDTLTVGSRKLGDTLDDRWRRLRDLARRIGDHILPHDTNLVVVEQPAYSSQTGHMHDRSGLWWLVVADLHHLAVPVAEVVPGTLKKYATGKGNASKDQVLLATAKAWPQVDLAGNDEADALNLAALGIAHLGHPVGGAWTKARAEAVAKVQWPAQDRLP